MAFRFHYEHLTAPPPEPARFSDSQVLAYTLVEIARIRCEQLWVDSRPERVELRAIHRDLGLAGYYACAGMLPGTRRECLALAHDRCSAYPLRAFRSGVQALFEGAVAAADALGDVLFALESPGYGELSGGQAQMAEIQVAHLHAVSAAASVDRLQSELRSR